MAKVNKQNIDLENPEFQLAWNLLQNTRRSVFLTGKAGSGKSTFLKYITSHTKKQYVILAPTGIAAVNVGGQTLHSFFKIPFKPLLPDDPDYSPRKIRDTLRYPKKYIKLLQKLDLIVIDEISMVRCDIIDFIDKVLRIYCGNMREPFGGKQLLFVGDVFQLEPVVTRDMRDILRLYYNQFFFFNAHVFSQLELIPIELKKIYRQRDEAFVSLLDRVRVSRATARDMAMLNSRVNNGYKPEDDDFSITLATRRDTVDAINDMHMAALKTPEVTVTGYIDGTFPDSDLPTNKDLTLKQGAQVMFIRNDKEGRWVNGTIGKIATVDADSVEVELESGEVYLLEQEVWENVKYSYDSKEKKIKEDLLGTFKQLPIKPAWALTVHKSQGLTFNKVIIDFTGGAFTSGQTYVALSRCTSLEGMTLLNPLNERDIIVNSAITQFSYNFNSQKIISDALEREKANSFFSRATIAFNKDKFYEAFDLFIEGMKIINIFKNPVALRFIRRKMGKFRQMADKVNALEQTITEMRQTIITLANEFTELGNQAQEPGHKLDDISIKSAIANYNKALRLDPDNLNAMLGKARLLLRIGAEDQAEEEIKKALKLSSTYYDTLLLLADLNHARRDTTAEIKTLNRIIRSHRNQPVPYERLADLYERLDLDDYAEEYREKAKHLRQTAERKASRRKKK